MAREGLQKLAALLALPGELVTQVVDVLALEAQDLERFARLLVLQQGLGEALHQTLDAAEGIAVRRLQQREIGTIDQRQRDLLAHGIEELCLVGEMPVNGAARDAGRTRDVLQRRARHATAAEFLARRREDLTAGLLGFVLGSAHGAVGNAPGTPGSGSAHPFQDEAEPINNGNPKKAAGSKHPKFTYILVCI